MGYGESDRNFDAILNDYLQEYERAGLKVNRFTNVETFCRAYLEA